MPAHLVSTIQEPACLYVWIRGLDKADSTPSQLYHNVKFGYHIAGVGFRAEVITRGRTPWRSWSAELIAPRLGITHMVFTSCGGVPCVCDETVDQAGTKHGFSSSTELSQKYKDEARTWIGTSSCFSKSKRKLYGHQPIASASSQGRLSDDIK
jgi:hypothetical protein